jgi:predicted ABC-type ATPase
MDLNGRAMPEHPIVHVVAGPNGAGKTTFARKYLPHFARCDEFVNADLLAQGLSPFAPERVAFRAGRLMLERIDDLSRRGATFGFETTLAGISHLALLQRIRSGGYAIHLYFLWLPSADMAVERVAHRVKRGGHYVEEPVVRRRYSAGIKNLFRHYRPVLDRWILFDNSGAEPKVIAIEATENVQIVDDHLFAAITRNLDR